VAVCKTPAVVVSRRPLGESDRLVEFYTRDFGKLRGVAKSARRPRSRLASALEPFTLGELIFFDAGQRDLVRVDHFDIVHPFVDVREHLDRLGRGAWMIESVVRLTADRDPQPALFRLLVRGMKALEVSSRPAWVSACFAMRAVDLLGHRPRLDRCGSCHRPYPFAGAALDVGAGGLVCGRCRPGTDALPLSAAAARTLRRLHELRWEDAVELPLKTAIPEDEVSAALDGMVARLAGQIPRSARFLAQMRRSASRIAEPAPAGRPR